MRADRMYRAALRLYPGDYFAQFGCDIRAALTAGVCREWVVKQVPQTHREL